MDPVGTGPNDGLLRAPPLNDPQAEPGVIRCHPGAAGDLQGATIATHLSFLTVAGSRLKLTEYPHRIVNSETRPSRVVLVDDHPAVLRQVAQLLSGPFHVIDALLDGRNLEQSVELKHPDLVVLDITLPGVSGIDLARRLGEQSSPPKIVFLTVHADPDYAREALAVGAMGYVVKSRLVTDLIPALRAALEGRQFVSPFETSELDSTNANGQNRTA